MRIVALYDIHGNVDALDAVLADPAAAEADGVLIGGDAIPGPFAGDVLDRLLRLPVPVHWIRGNGEREVAAAAADQPVDEEDMAAATAAITAAALDAATVERLGALPITARVGGVVFCHATLRSDEEIVTRASTPDRYTAAFGAAGAGLVIAGHTHQQHDRQVGDTRVVNAGSVGLPYEGDGAARWAVVTDGEPELRQTAYDAVAAGERMLAAGWPDAESVRAALIDPVAPEVVTELFEARAGA